MNFLRCISLTALVWPILATPAVLANDGPRLSDVAIGLGGTYKVGYWTPVRVTIDGGGNGFSGRIEFAAPDGDDLTAHIRSAGNALVEVGPGEQWTGWRYLKIGRIKGRVQVILRDEDGRTVQSQAIRDQSPQPATWQWIITTGTDVAVEEAAVYLARVRDERVVSTLLTDAADFPDRWFGYEGVNVLVIPLGSENVLETLSDEQFSALLQWLRLGGRFVMSAGRRAPELFAADHPFYALRPGTFLELDPFWKASGLENFARAGERVDPDQQAPLSVFTQLQGDALCLEGAGGSDDRALVTQYAFGFGEIIFVALDLDVPPLSTWPARPRLLARLLQLRSEEEDSAMSDQRMAQVTHVGYEDLSGQLRAALDQFPGVTLVQFSWVAVLLAVYILIMGPLEYFGLRKLGRPQWTWITFPVTVLLFCGLAVWLSHSWKGSTLLVNHVDIVDVDVSQQLVRGTTWANIYSPDATSLGVGVTPDTSWSDRDDSPAAAFEVLTSWQGLPGSGMGGMDSPSSVDLLRDEQRSDEYRIHIPLAPEAVEAAQVEGLPIQTASSKGLLSRWASPASLGDVEPLAANQFDLLEGVVTNPLDVELSHCRVYFRNWSYPLDKPLAPGESVRIGSAQPLDLRWQLTRRSVVGTTEVRTSWLRGDLSDIDRILEMLMFYGAAGGRAYTGLSHNYQSFIDLSRHLYSGRAILVGRSEEPASQLVIHRTADGSDQVVGSDAEQRWTYYRIVIPVEPAIDDDL